MIILPVGLDDSEVRRTPWVTWVVMGLCLLVHLGVTTLGGGADREASERIEEALRYLAEHPYLSPPATLDELLGDEGRESLGRAAAEWSARFEPVSEAVAEREQEELDRLDGEARRALRRRPENRLGFVPAHPNAVNLVTSTFVHAGWVHLLGNMLFLFLSGPFIEDLYGRPIFALLYLVSGAAGDVAFAAGDPKSTLPLVGASGAIAGVMGAFLVRLATRRIELLVLPFPIVPTFRFKLRFPAFVVIPLWGAEQLYSASAGGDDSPVAFAAHVGGLLFGVLFALVLALLRVEERFVNPAVEREISFVQDPAITGAADARLAGDLAGARRLVDGVLRRDPLNVDAWTQSFEIALAGGDGASASQAGLRLLELHRRADEELVWTVVNDRRWRELRMSSRFLSAMADLLARSGDTRGAIDLCRRIAAEAPADVAALRALVTEGELLARAKDERSARAAFDRARAHPACSEPWLARIDEAGRQISKQRTTPHFKT